MIFFFLSSGFTITVELQFVNKQVILLKLKYIIKDKIKINIIIPIKVFIGNCLKNTDNKLENKVFVITGKVKEYKNRDELKNVIESMGGKVTGSVSKNTNYLINNDTESTSAKNLKAKELDIPIISELEFKKIFDIK